MKATTKRKNNQSFIKGNSVMSVCSICGRSCNRLEESFLNKNIGDPPKPIREVVYLDILHSSGKSYKFANNNGLCRKCFQKIANFYKSLQNAEQLKQELLDLMAVTYVNVENLLTIKDEISPIKLEDTEFVDSFNIVDENIWNDNLQEDILALKNHDEIKIEVNHNGKDSNIDVKYDLQTSASDKKSVNKTSGELKDSNKTAFKKRKCTQCDEFLESQYHYKMHMQKFHTSSYVCEHCGKTLYSYIGFRQHLIAHSGNKRFKCTLCDKSFYEKQSLKYHLAYHEGSTPFKCNTCSKEFVTKVALRKHTDVHDDNTKKYTCTECESKYRTKQHLARHMSVHTGLTPFSCHICGKRFTRSCNMKRHVKEHEQPGSTRVRRYRCKECSRTFTNTDNYKKHCEEANCQPKLMNAQNSFTSSSNSLFQ